MKKNYTFLILLGIIILGAFLRFHKLGENSFVADEFLDINSSYAYKETGEWQNWDFNFGRINEENAFAPRDERAWVYKWQSAFLFRFLPPTESVARIPSVLWGILSIILIYLVAKDFTKNRTIALISAFLFAVSLDAIEFDRKFRMYAMFLPIFLGFSWSLFQALEREYSGKTELFRTIWKKLRLNLPFLLLTLLLGALSLLTHLLTVNIAFILAGYFLTLYLIDFRKGKRLNRYGLFLLLEIIAIAIGIAFFHGKLDSALQGLGWTAHLSYIGKTLSDYETPLLAIVFLFSGIVYLWSKASLKKEALWLSWSFLGVLFLAIFIWDRNAGNQYIFFVQPFKMILIASGIYCLATFLLENLGQKFREKGFWTTIVVSLLVLPNFAYFFAKDNFYNQTSSSDNPDYRSIFSYFKKKRGEEDVLVTRNFRNYYFAGEKVPVFDFGGEMDKNKVTFERINSIVSENPSGWVIFSDNDEVFITKEAEDFITKNMEKINDIQVRGKVSVYRWGNGK